MSEERKLMSGLLSKQTSFALMVTGPLGADEVDVLIRKLEIDKEVLARAAGIQIEGEGK